MSATRRRIPLAVASRHVIQLTIAAMMALTGTFASTAVSHAASSEDVVEVKGDLCRFGQQKWEIFQPYGANETNAATKEAYVECRGEFVVRGVWYGLAYLSRNTNSLRHGWKTKFESLTILMLLTDASDAQDQYGIASLVMEDRGLRGRAVFGARGTFGSTTSARELFYVPLDPRLDDEQCTGETCEAKGAEYADHWQSIYDEAIKIALTHYKDRARHSAKEASHR